MPLDAKVNGVSIEYTPSPIERLYERLSLSNQRNFYTKKDGEMTRVRIHPAYLDTDMFKYRANIYNDRRDITTRLAEPKREVLEIITVDFNGKISIERDLNKKRTLIKKIAKDKSLEIRRILGLNDLEEIEAFVRGLY